MDKQRKFIALIITFVAFALILLVRTNSIVTPSTLAFDDLTVKHRHGFNSEIGFPYGDWEISIKPNALFYYQDKRFDEKISGTLASDAMSKLRLAIAKSDYMALEEKMFQFGPYVTDMDQLIRQ